MPAPAYAAKQPAPANTMRLVPVPVPMAGIDAVTPAVAMSPEKAIYVVNLVAGSRGLQPRPGTQEHATNVGTVAGDVRAILPFHSTGTLDRLFATAVNGIYDVTTSGSAPPLKRTFGVQDASAGFGEAQPFVNVAGNRFLLYIPRPGHDRPRQTHRSPRRE